MAEMRKKKPKNEYSGHMDPAKSTCDSRICLSFVQPGPDDPYAEYASDIDVIGTIGGACPPPSDSSLTVSLLDAQGQVLRYAKADRPCDDRMALYHKLMTAYPEAEDPGRRGILKFGFPEILVEDPLDPDLSMTDATRKCWLDGHVFKAMLVSATDRDHGKILDDGIGFTDDKGRPYSALPEGTYRVHASLTRGNVTLAEASAPLIIRRTENQAIVRFHPESHRRRVSEWCRSHGFSVADALVPGYLDAYLGHWEYHMGLLPLYRANDLAAYAHAHVHMFVYLADPGSTSYATELAYLQKEGIVGDNERFTAWHYDIGEAVIRHWQGGKKEADIVPFSPEEDLYVCRVDCLRGECRDNVFDICESGLDQAVSPEGVIRVAGGQKVAVMGVIRPYQRDPLLYERQADNTYLTGNMPLKIRYVISDGKKKIRKTKDVCLERIENGTSIGKSMYEFYHILSFEDFEPRAVVQVEMTLYDGGQPRKSGRAVLSFRLDGILQE